MVAARTAEYERMRSRFDALLRDVSEAKRKARAAEQEAEAQARLSRKLAQSGRERDRRIEELESALAVARRTRDDAERQAEAGRLSGGETQKEAGRLREQLREAKEALAQARREAGQALKAAREARKERDGARQEAEEARKESARLQEELAATVTAGQEQKEREGQSETGGALSVDGKSVGGRSPRRGATEAGSGHGSPSPSSSTSPSKQSAAARRLMGEVSSLKEALQAAERARSAALREREAAEQRAAGAAGEAEKAEAGRQAAE